jgi:hypothetical protein
MKTLINKWFTLAGGSFIHNLQNLDRNKYWEHVAQLTATSHHDGTPVEKLPALLLVSGCSIKSKMADEASLVLRFAIFSRILILILQVSLS